MPEYITPYLPNEAIPILKAEYKAQRHIFHKVVKRSPTISYICPNCADLGSILVTVAESGPYRFVPAGKQPVTWYDGDEFSGKGWYVVSRTLEFICPECPKHVKVESPEGRPVETDAFVRSMIGAMNEPNAQRVKR